jgi:hypothetical protein
MNHQQVIPERHKYVPLSPRTEFFHLMASRICLSVNEQEAHLYNLDTRVHISTRNPRIIKRRYAVMMHHSARVDMPYFLQTVGNKLCYTDITHKPATPNSLKSISTYVTADNTDTE